MKVLVVIDAQNDFIDGVLGTKEAVAAVPKIVEKIRQYKSMDEGSIVVATMDTHFRRTFFDTQEGKNLPILHCEWWTPGWKLHPEIAEKLSDLKTDNFYEKDTFGAKQLVDDLQYYLDMDDLELKEVEIVGFCTDVCVITNALLFKTYCPEVRIIVDADCCAGTSPELHHAALQVMKQCQISVINEGGHNDSYR